VIVFVDGREFCELQGRDITEHNLVAAMNGSAVGKLFAAYAG
jgi:ribose transport system ATP-binding protein